jgi:antitoxin component YwqK of YwqJK toxin-antitoxin module
MKRLAWAAAALLLQCALSSAAEAALYRSNAAGMLLEPIPRFRRDESEFVMEVERKGDLEVGRLYQSGKESKRWEIVTSRDGARSEREYDGNVLSAKRAYNPSGSILWEETYTDGKLSQKSIYEYDEGLPASIRVQDSKGALVYSERFQLGEHGSLRRVLRTYADGSVSSSWYAAGDAGLSEERNTVAGVSFIRRYDPKGRVTVIEQLKDGELASRRELTYRGDTDNLLSAMEAVPAENKLISEDYDQDGRLLQQRVSVSDKEVERTDYARSKEGRVETARRTSGEGIEEWRYTYDSSGDVSTEKYFRKGILEKITVYTAKGERYEELYKDGELFLKAYYKDEVKTKEEVYEKGVLVRERSFP